MKLLVVDDSKLYQKATAKYFKEFLPDAELYFAHDGVEGYEMYKKINPDVMTIDLLMPRMGGIELLKEIQKDDHHVKLFVLSADVQKLVKEEVQGLGATFINKPLTADKAAEIAEIIKG